MFSFILTVYFRNRIVMCPDLHGTSQEYKETRPAELQRRTPPNLDFSSFTLLTFNFSLELFISVRQSLKKTTKLLKKKKKRFLRKIVKNFIKISNIYFFHVQKHLVFIFIFS